MSISDQYRSEAEQLQMFLSEIGDLLEPVSGFVQRDSKFGGKERVQVISLDSIENGKASLNEFVEVAYEQVEDEQAQAILDQVNVLPKHVVMGEQSLYAASL